MALPDKILSSNTTATIEDVANVVNDLFDYASNTNTNLIDLTNDVSEFTDIINADYATDPIGLSIPATLIGDGTVDNIKFSYLNGTTFNVQTEITDIETIVESWKTDSVTEFISAHTISSGLVDNDSFIGLADLHAHLSILDPSNRRSIDGEIAHLRERLTFLVTNDQVDAADIADGSVSNGEFELLNGVTGNLQDQLNSLSNKIINLGSVTGNTVTISATSIANGSVSNAELGYASTLNDDIHKQLHIIYGLYNDTLQSNYIDNTTVRISATSISTGVVSNTEFQYLNGVSSNIQSQLNSINTSLSALGSVADNIVMIDAARLGGTWSNTEWDYLSTITSDAQTQLDRLEKLLGHASAQQTFSGRISAIRIATRNVSNTNYQHISGLESNAQDQISDIIGNLTTLGVTDTIEINANKVATGTVSNEAFEWLSGIGENIQDCLDRKLDGELRYINLNYAYKYSDLNSEGSFSQGGLFHATPIFVGSTHYSSANRTIRGFELNGTTFELNDSQFSFNESGEVRLIEYDYHCDCWILILLNGNSAKLVIVDELTESEIDDKLSDENYWSLTLSTSIDIPGSTLLNGYWYYFEGSSLKRRNIYSRSSAETITYYYNSSYHTTFSNTGKLTYQRDKNSLVWTNSNIYNLTYNLTNERWNLSVDSASISSNILSMFTADNKTYYVDSSQTIRELHYTNSNRREVITATPKNHTLLIVR